MNRKVIIAGASSHNFKIKKIMTLEHQKINLARKILGLKSEKLINQMNKIIEENDWENVTDNEISAIQIGLADIELNKTFTNEEVQSKIDELFNKYSAKI